MRHQGRGAALAADDERALHERLLADDPVAPSDLAVAYLDPLTGWLAAHNSAALDPHVCAMAAGDALVALSKKPQVYDPARAGLEAYLRMSAQGRLKNLLRAERRHGARRASWEAVEVSPERAKYLGDEQGDPALIVLAREAACDAAGLVPPVPASVRAGLTAQEEKVLERMRQGERTTDVYAAILGLTHLPAAERRRAVKRVKDRLSKRVERAGDQHG